MSDRERTIRIKTLLLQQERTQISMARDLGIAESELSKIINGYRKPSEALKNQIASYLGADIGVIFPDPTV